jgi:hypothetical protein
VSCHQRDAATHTARLQVGWYIIFMASPGVVGWWCSDATIASEILVLVQIPNIANLFLMDDRQKMVDNKQKPYLSHLKFILIPLWRGFYFSEDILSDHIP